MLHLETSNTKKFPFLDMVSESSLTCRSQLLTDGRILRLLKVSPDLVLIDGDDESKVGPPLVVQYILDCPGLEQTL